MNETSICGGLFGKTRQGVLALLYGQVDRSFYTKQVLDAIRVGRGTVQRELRNLTDAGIIIREVQGRQVYYRANEHCPIFIELKGIVRKTFGIGDVIKQYLAPKTEKVKAAFIFGSVASGTDIRRSDIDVMVVGDVSFGEVSAAISRAEKDIQREINPVVYSLDEFKQKVTADHHFVKTVMEGPKIYLVGNERELRKLVE